MVLVIIASLLTAALFAFFRAFAVFKVPLLPAIVVNYLVAFLFGLAFSRPWEVSDLSMIWVPALLQGAVFIGLFHLMGRASQRIGIAPTTVASKMSLALTVLITVILFHERPSAITWTGIALAVIGVVLSSWGGGMRDGRSWWFIPVLFLANAFSDVLLNISQRISITPITEASFAAFIFGAAALFGLCWLAFRKDRVALADPRVWIGGGLLGCVNYGSVYFMVRALSSSGLPGSSVFPLVNVGVILFGSAASIILFKERLRPLHWAGIVLSVAALGCILAGRS
jgi:drug/metabolite transporter (DMT)-like permease